MCARSKLLVNNSARISGRFSWMKRVSEAHFKECTWRVMAALSDWSGPEDGHSR